MAASAHNGTGLLWMRRAHGARDHVAFTEAYDAFGRAVESDRESADALHNLATIAQELGKQEESRDAFERALELDPARNGTRVRLARVLLVLGEPREAAEHLVEALRRDPDFVDAYYTLGAEALSRRRYGIAADELETVVRLDPGRGLGHFHLGRAYKELGRLEESQQAFRRAVKLMPKYAPAYTELAHTYGAVGQRVDIGIELAREGTELSPDSKQAHNTLSWLYFLAGDYDAAETAILRSIELDPGNATLQEALAAIRDGRRQATSE